MYKRQRLDKLKKQKRKRIVLASSIVVFLVVGFSVYTITTKGFDYLKDNILGHPTKELSEGEWIYSEYGNPGCLLYTSFRQLKTMIKSD